MQQNQRNIYKLLLLLWLIIVKWILLQNIAYTLKINNNNKVIDCSPMRR